MIRYSLRCDQGHDFDGWFRSSDGFETLRAAGLPQALAALARDAGGQRRMGAAARALLLARAGNPATLIGRIAALARRGLA